MSEPSDLDKKTNSGSDLLALAAVVLAGLGLLGLTAYVSWLSQSFPYEQNPGRPIVRFVFVSWLASAVALSALLIGFLVTKSRKRLFGAIILFAIAFRLIYVFSNPILEVDYYRYLWDGVAANQGVSPYKFSPQAVLHAQSNDSELQLLQQVIVQKPNLKTIVSRVHFEGYTTLYPPVSQFVFRTTTAIVPDDASVDTHIIAIKCALVLFDLGVVFCLTWMISFFGKHPAWLMTYAWNPLVLKEISNGGHLDSIAIFFMTAGVGVFLWGIVRKSEVVELIDESNAENPKPFWWPALSGSLMALGIGSKLFPVILLPAMFFFLVVKMRWVNAIMFGLTCAIVTPLVMMPMFGNSASAPEPVVQQQPVNTQQQTTDGLTVFMTNWRMNDAIFSFVYQNVEYDWKPHGTAWYVFVPNETRIEWCKELSQVELTGGNPAYFIARIVTVALFGLFYLGIIVRLLFTQSAEDFAGILFLVMGVFFFLQPTQNPWYWLWAMPLVCFAKNRGWLFVSMILFVYYLRFWYTELESKHEFFGTTYIGYDFYDHCIVWIEFAVVLAILFVFHFLKQLETVNLRDVFGRE